LEPSAETLCGVHPKERAVDVCERCGTFLCFGCVQSLTGTVYCGPCVERLTAPPPLEPAPGRVYVYLALALLGCLFFPFALAAILLGYIERRRILSGHAPRAGERYARLAGTLAIAAVLVNMLVLPMILPFVLHLLLR
jgi:hypothetical protein